MYVHNCVCVEEWHLSVWQVRRPGWVHASYSVFIYLRILGHWLRYLESALLLGALLFLQLHPLMQGSCANHWDGNEPEKNKKMVRQGKKK